MKEVGTLKHIRVLKFLSMLALIITILFVGGFSGSSQSYYISSSDYVLNTSVKKIHKPSCSAIKYTNPKHIEKTDSYLLATLRGYKPCKACNPQQTSTSSSAIIYFFCFLLSYAPILIIIAIAYRKFKESNTLLMIIPMIVAELLTVPLLEKLCSVFTGKEVDFPTYPQIIVGIIAILAYTAADMKIYRDVPLSFRRFRRILFNEASFSRFFEDFGYSHKTLDFFDYMADKIWKDLPVFTFKSLFKEKNYKHYDLKQEIEDYFDDVDFPKDELCKDTITDDVSDSSNDTFFCRKCGTKLLNDSTFCHKCGTEVITNNN